MEILRIPSLTCTFKLLSDVTWPKELSFLVLLCQLENLSYVPIVMQQYLIVCHYVSCVDF